MNDEVEQPQEPIDRVMTMDEVYAMMNDPNTVNLHNTAPIATPPTPEELQQQVNDEFEASITGRNCQTLRERGVTITIDAADLVMLAGLALRQYATLLSIDEALQGQAPVVGKHRIVDALEHSMRLIDSAAEENDLIKARVVEDPVTGRIDLIELTEEELAVLDTANNNDPVTTDSDVSES